MRQHELEADQQRGGQGGELERRLAPRHERRRDGADDQQRLQHLLQRRRSGIPFAWYWPQSQSENGEWRVTWIQTVWSQKTRSAWPRSGSSSSTESEARVATTKPATAAGRRGRRSSG